ncbi:hypothetical protein BpHYR1_030750 [Brachionus plicatilis]|uniref:Uncharacterized protein n=1 Tax=Brachionus plicatilis TaxID=10195 RepID=A0A3M7T7Z5_BRAPC|nr:hypothetical protein BpHYR1_030750 [Brachionus plicatilis]
MTTLVITPPNSFFISLFIPGSDVSSNLEIKSVKNSCMSFCSPVFNTCWSMVYTLHKSFGVYDLRSDSCKKANIFFTSTKILSYCPASDSLIFDSSTSRLASLIMNKCCSEVAIPWSKSCSSSPFLSTAPPSVSMPTKKLSSTNAGLLAFKISYVSRDSRLVVMKCISLPELTSLVSAERRAAIKSKYSLQAIASLEGLYWLVKFKSSMSSGRNTARMRSSMTHSRCIHVDAALR